MMDIDLELLGGLGEVPLQRRVAGDTSVFGWGGNGSSQRQE